MRVLVTGTTGWLGGNLADSLVKQGHCVVGTSRKQIEGCAYTVIKLDITNDAEVRRVLQEQPMFDVIVHLAGALGWCTLKEGIDINLGGTRAVMEAAIERGIKKFVIASSVATVGSTAPNFPPRKVPISPTHPNVKGPWPYAISKAHVEDLCTTLSQIHNDLDIIALRIGNVVTAPPEIVHHDGKGIKYPVLPATSDWTKLQIGESASEYIFPEGPLCSIALPDMIACLHAATDAPFKNSFRVLNAVGPTSYSSEPVADVLRSWYGDSHNIAGIETFEFTGRERAPLYDSEATFQELGWRPQIDLNTGVPLVRKPVILVIHKRVDTGHQRAWLDMANTLASCTRAENGCEYYDFFAVDKDDTMFFIVERWASETHLSHHANTEHFRHLVPCMDDISETLSFSKCRDSLEESIDAQTPCLFFATPSDASFSISFCKPQSGQASLPESTIASATKARQSKDCIYFNVVAATGTAGHIVVSCSRSPATPDVDGLTVESTMCGTNALKLQPGRTVTSLKSNRDLSTASRNGRVLVMYDSSTSYTRKMAQLVSEGVLQLDRTEVRVRRIGGSENTWDSEQQRGDPTEEATFEDILWADGIACGTPTNLGCVSWRVKKFWDEFSQAGHWSFVDGKVGCSFSSEGGIGGGAELVCMAMNAILMNFGFSVFGVTDYVGSKDTLHYGATVAKAPRDPMSRMACRRLGLRLAEFVGYYILHRPETHPMMASKRRDMKRFGAVGIPPRSVDPSELERMSLEPLRLQDKSGVRPTALIFTHMADYVHDSTPAAAARCASLAERRGYLAVVSSDASFLEDPKYKWDVVVLVNISGEAFNPDKETLTAHIAEGRGVLGVHACLASFLSGEDASGAKPLEHNTSLIADVFGAHFVNHPPPLTTTVYVECSAVQEALGGVFASSPAAALNHEYTHHDEFFNFDRQLPEDAVVLARVKEELYEGGTMGADHPMVWCRLRGTAPVFYCGLGHFDALYEPDTLVSTFLETGLNFCAPDVRFSH